MTIKEFEYELNQVCEGFDIKVHVHQGEKQLDVDQVNDEKVIIKLTRNPEIEVRVDVKNAYKDRTFFVISPPSHEFKHGTCIIKKDTQIEGPYMVTVCANWLNVIYDFMKDLSDEN